MKKKLVALVNLAVAGTHYEAGKTFEIESEQDANYLLNRKRAKLAEDVEDVEAEKPVKKDTKGKAK